MFQFSKAIVAEPWPPDIGSKIGPSQYLGSLSRYSDKYNPKNYSIPLFNYKKFQNSAFLGLVKHFAVNEHFNFC